ncbi:MAG: YkgJ family cysteine cluster protein [Proteobacteria bacterium]|nr:YkgJ family cysteine cluster protein [Pseudomonadota bacterium]
MTARYRELTAKVDGFFARVEARHAADLQCHTGCSDCCHARLTVTKVEAAAIVAHVATLAVDRRAALHAAAQVPSDRCAALDEAGRCRIYDARPLVCRSHGAPIRLREGRSLPVVQACARNFTARGPAAADADCVIDQTTLSALLLAVNREACAPGEDPTGREDLAALLVRVTW